MEKYIRKFLKEIFPCVFFTLVTLSVTVHAHAHADNACHHFVLKLPCVVVPLAPAAQDAEAKQFITPTNGMARLYMIRDFVSVHEQRMTLLVNGQAVADIAPFTYAAIDIAAGKYRINALSTNKAEIALDVKAGKLYFLKANLHLMLNTVSANLMMLDEAEGKREVSESDRVIALPFAP
ncbi:DUF2846 domain-containing protein [Herbaspirillum sp. RTI4]|uniref:DUF2846 domain-containing protein n=1 Tax=Herbaspirillum sp. RTI4 TaxID=3048640 RepID=UPI002AB38AC9|nr:DUF2846 domain-containing protein [Herbaspirillum sp. RTI4]MDY7578882.1 DUF2846 domain-containing protein [Herbaspirillum sp. RTI4]MEA9981971.1 DUF2846 domain-containing protein [Herbaspirillum sp. RTI4]